MAAAHTSRGRAFGDFDNDGDVDILVMNMNEPPSLLRNDVSGTGHWLKVFLIGVKSNAAPLARVSRPLRSPDAGTGRQRSIELLFSERPALHFGLGDARIADLTIRWPTNGLTEKIPNVEADHLVVVREGSRIERREKFGPR